MVGLWYITKILGKAATLTPVETRLRHITEKSLSDEDRKTLIKSITEHNECMKNFSPKRLQEITQRVQSATIATLLSILKIEKKVTLLLKESRKKRNMSLVAIVLYPPLFPLIAFGIGSGKVFEEPLVSFSLIAAVSFAIIATIKFPLSEAREQEKEAKETFQTFENPGIKSPSLQSNGGSSKPLKYDKNPPSLG